MASSPWVDDFPLVQASEVDSRMACVLYVMELVVGLLVADLSSQVLAAMESMLNKISEIDQKAVGVMEEIERSKASALERKKALGEERGRVEKAAITVLDLFNHRDTN